MPEFIAIEPQTQVTGVTILTITAAMDALGGDARPFLAKHGLLEIKPDEWYSLQACLDTLKDISTNGQNFYNLVSLGNKVPEFFPLPPEVNSVEKAFAVLDDLYHSAHRDGEIGHYVVEEVEPHHIRVTSINPGPSDFDFGLCWGLARRFAPEPSTVKVIRADSPSRKNGDDRCIYTITW